MHIETHDLRRLDADVISLLLNRFTFSDGWMRPIVRQMIRGKIKSSYNVRQMNYTRGLAHIAVVDGEIVGWALTRIPERVIKRRVRYVKGGPCRHIAAGKRPDIMIFVGKNHRRQGIARKLVLVAYNLHGRMDAYPHDLYSRIFFFKVMKKFVNPIDSWKLSSAELILREVCP